MHIICPTCRGATMWIGERYGYFDDEPGNQRAFDVYECEDQSCSCRTMVVTDSPEEHSD